MKLRRMSNRRNAIPSTRSSMNKPPHFTKILIPSTLKDNKLKLPLKFVNRFGNEIRGKIAKFEVADGRVWDVGIYKNGGDIWFKEGWTDIVKYYSLGYGSLLFFKYEKNSTFQVVICDLSNSEIDYPCDNGEESESEPKPENEVEEQNDDMNEDGKEIWDLFEEMEIYVSNSFKRLSIKEKKVAMEAARMFNPQNPSFMVFMIPTYISSYQMYIPVKFNKYLSGDLKFAKLQVWSGKAWTVGIVSRENKGLILTKGWGKFMKEQKLKEGDVCLFELIKTNKKKKNPNDIVSLKVSIFHANLIN